MISNYWISGVKLPKLILLLSLISIGYFSHKLNKVSLVLAKSSRNESNQLRANSSRIISMRMPDIRPDHGEQYLCIAHRLDKRFDESIVAFEPKLGENHVHHMLLYGCQMPGIYQRDSPTFVWDCSSMFDQQQQQQQQQQPESSFEKGPVCADGAKMEIIYGWAMGAPPLKLPHGVGFKVGARSSGINYLVLQVHYGQHNAFMQTPQLTDNSGIQMEVSRGLQTDKQAGILLMSSVGHVPIGRSKHEIWCQIDDLDEDGQPIEVHPFRYRVHTHKLGVNVLGAKIASSRSAYNDFQMDQAELIGEGDPQEAQMFYPVRDTNLTLKSGDRIYASCEFENDQARIVRIGQTGKDEMCNFYIMYWTSSGKLLSRSNCMSQNPPNSISDTLFGAILEG